jgi:hypothetical protein
MSKRLKNKQSLLNGTNETLLARNTFGIAVFILFIFIVEMGRRFMKLGYFETEFHLTYNFAFPKNSALINTPREIVQSGMPQGSILSPCCTISI